MQSDWTNGGSSPLELDMGDFEKIKNTKACFARKLGKNKELVLKIIKNMN